eukprot:1054508-Pelagomonas_calceolata.AAC.2
MFFNLRGMGDQNLALRICIPKSFFYLVKLIERSGCPARMGSSFGRGPWRAQTQAPLGLRGDPSPCILEYLPTILNAHKQHVNTLTYILAACGIFHSKNSRPRVTLPQSFFESVVHTDHTLCHDNRLAVRKTLTSLRD